MLGRTSSRPAPIRTESKQRGGPKAPRYRLNSCLGLQLSGPNEIIYSKVLKVLHFLAVGVKRVKVEQSNWNPQFVSLNKMTLPSNMATKTFSKQIRRCSGTFVPGSAATVKRAGITTPSTPKHVFLTGCCCVLHTP